MYKLILENASGSQLVFNRLGGAFTITDIDGLAAPAAIINTNESALMDGATYNSAKQKCEQSTSLLQSNMMPRRTESPPTTSFESKNRLN